VDQPQNERNPDGAVIAGLSADMRIGAGPAAAPRAPSARAPAPPRPVRAGRLPLLLGLVAAAIGLAALAAAAWIYADTRREILRLSTDLAQLRLSLDLYDRNAGAGADAGSGEALTDIANRLAILEQSWRGGGATPQPATAAPAASAPAGEDCLPPGMRILVAAGDAYTVCGVPASVEIATVANGYITLADGSTIASGGTFPLLGTACMLGVTSSGDEGLTGYAEIRVTC